MERSLFNKVILGSALFMLTACSHGAIMTRNDFDNIQTGASVSEIVEQYGDPIRIVDYKDGSQGYEYIERLPIGEQTVVENNYFIVVKNGKVIGKRYNNEEPPAYDEVYEEDPNAIIN